MTVKAIEYNAFWEDGTVTREYNLFKDFSEWLDFKKNCVTDWYDHCIVVATEVVCIHISEHEYERLSDTVLEIGRFTESAIDRAMKRIFK